MSMLKWAKKEIEICSVCGQSAYVSGITRDMLDGSKTVIAIGYIRNM